MRITNYYNAQANILLWRSVENMAIAYPNISRLSSLPICAALFFKYVLFLPASFVEESYLTVKAFKEYCIEQDPWMFDVKRGALQSHFIEAKHYFSLTGPCPLIALMASVVALSFTFFHPLKYAKVQLAQNQFDLFLFEQEQNYLLMLTGNPTIHFANEVKFAEAALKRYCRKVEQAIDREELHQLHFLDREDTRQAMINEVAAKNRQFITVAQQAYNHYYFNLDQAGDHFEEEKRRLNAAWKSFQKNFIVANLEESAGMALYF